MKIHEVVTEERRPDIKEQLLNAVRRDGGNLNEYFVRFTDIDKLGYSNRQWFGKTPDVDHPEFSVDYIGHSIGRRALWFYPLEVFLKRHHVYASEQPYVWLVRIKPDAWLQPVRSGDREVMPAPEGRERVGILRYSQVPAAIFFKPGFKLVERFYNYAWRHRRHGEVKGPPPPSFFDRIRGLDENDEEISENFADGRKPGRKGLAKRMGVNCKQPVSKLRKIAKNSSGERQRMAHWCANMKSGRRK